MVTRKYLEEQLQWAINLNAEGYIEVVRLALEAIAAREAKAGEVVVEGFVFHDIMQPGHAFRSGYFEVHCEPESEAWMPVRCVLSKRGGE